MGTEQMTEIGALIGRAVKSSDGDPDHPVAREVRAAVGELVGAFPAYPRG